MMDTQSQIQQLNQHEIEVLKQLSQGQSYKQVAATMDKGLSTVKLYMKQAKDKLGVQSSKKAIVLFVTLFDA